jgi:hypothetical protein
MAFLNKKEQSLIIAIKANDHLSSVKKNELTKEVKYNARLRQDRYRQGVKVFLSVLSSFNTNKITQEALK